MTVQEIPKVNASTASIGVQDPSEALPSGTMKVVVRSGSSMSAPVSRKSSGSIRPRKRAKSSEVSLDGSNQLKESSSTAGAQQSEDVGEPICKRSRHCEEEPTAASTVLGCEVDCDKGIEGDDESRESTCHVEENSDSSMPFPENPEGQASATTDDNASPDADMGLENVNPRKRKRRPESRNNLDESNPQQEGSSSAAEQSEDFAEPPRKASRQDEVQGTSASAADKDEINDNKGIEGCSQQPGSGNDAAMQNALPMLANIKTELLPLPFGGLDSGAGTPDLGYVHYYLSTAYQLLFGAVPQGAAVGAIPQSSNVSHAQEESTQTNGARTRRRRRRRVWDGESFVAEDPAREQTAPYTLRRRRRRN